ncbi:DEAD/DEAH box helicase family protein, partial [Rhodococcus koreensis]
MAAAQRAFATAQQRGLQAGIVANTENINSITGKLERLRTQWRVQSAREGELRNQIHALGVDPHEVPRALVQEMSTAERTPQAGWRSERISRSQIRKLEQLAGEVAKPFTVDTTITKGEAHDLISGILSGNLKEVQFRERPAGPLFPEAAPTDAVPVDAAGADTSAGIDPVAAAAATTLDATAEVEARILQALAEPDIEADTSAASSANTAIGFLAWAEGHFKTKAQVALADLMSDRRSISDEMFTACRTILLNTDRWHELGRKAAEAYWEVRRPEAIGHPITTAIVDAVVAARDADEREVGESYLETAQRAAESVLAADENTDTDLDPDLELDDEMSLEQAEAELLDINTRIETLEAVQEALDLGVIPEDDWYQRARAKFDPAAPLELPHPDVDPAFATALRKLKSEKAREALTNQWWKGCKDAQREATGADQTFLYAAAAADPNIIDAVGGRLAADLAAHFPFEEMVRDKIVDLARNGSTTRQAAAQLIVRDLRQLEDVGFYDTVTQAWTEAHRDDLTWDESVRDDWTQWMRAHLRSDPLVATWAGLPSVTRVDELEAAIEVAFDVLGFERPDLIEATASIGQERLAAELRRTIVPNLHDDIEVVYAKNGHEYFEQGGQHGLRLKSKPRSGIRHVSVGWEYTLNGAGTEVNCGDDYRVAVGGLLEAAGHPMPAWVERTYRPVREARDRVTSTATMLARGHEFYHAAAHSDPLWVYSKNGSAAADTEPVQEARRGIISDLRRTLPADVSLLEAKGFDLDWVLRAEVDRALITELRKKNAKDPYATFDVSDLTIYQNGHVFVGDVDGTHVDVTQLPSMTDTPNPITLDGQTYADVHTFRDAIDQARVLLPRKRAAVSSDITEVTATTETEAGRDAQTPSEQATANEIEIAAEPASEPVLEDHPETTDQAEGVDPSSELPGAAEAAPTEQQAPAADAELLVVPDHVHGEPITSPLWRNGGLIEVRKESGGHVWVSPETAAEYTTASTDTATEPGITPAPETPAPLTPDELAALDPLTATTDELAQRQALLESMARDSEAVEETEAEETEVEEIRRPTQPTAAPADFQLGTDILVPSGAKARVRANIAAARLVTELGREQRPATADEQAVLAQWSGWGAVPEVFDNRARFRETWRTERNELYELLGERGFAQARETTLNAHYTDPAVVHELWRAVERAGMPRNALMLEPGCGAGYFVGTAPAGVNMVGVEIEPISAQIAHHLYPSQQIRNHGFERNFAGNGTFTGAIGNVPFGKDGVYDPIHNADGHSLHNQFIVKSLALTAPGGYVAVVTSAYTSDARRPGARQKITETADLIGAVRLPTGAFDRQAKTAVVTDVLVFRRRPDGQEPSPETAAWAGEGKSIPLDRRGAEEGATTSELYWINRYFEQHPERVLGTLAIGNGANGKRNLIVEPRTHTPLSEQLRRQFDPIIDRAVDRGLGFTAPGPAPTAAAPFTAAGLLTGTGIEETTVEPGTMRFDEVKGQFEQFKIGQGWTYVNCIGKDKAEQWKVLIALGETVMSLTEASRRVDSTRAERDALRVQLGTLYDRYTHRWGPLNRFTLTEPAPLTEKKIAERLDKAITRWRIKIGKAEAREDGLSAEEAGPYTGPIPDDVLEDMQDKAATEPIPQKNQSHLKGAILRDPRIGMVLSIENFTSRFDGTHAEASKSPIFTEDTTPFKSRAETAEHVDEAMAISFDELGYLSPERMGELLDLEVGDVIDQARGRMFPSLDHPGAWEIAETFLSGHVRDKHAKALRLAAEDPELYGGAAEALERVIPPDVDPAAIGVRPGAIWVPMEYYREFLITEFGLNPNRLTTEFDNVSGNWNFETDQKSRHKNPTSGYTDKYGSAQLSGVEMFNLIANNKAVQVLKTAEELERSPKPRFHPELTAAARSNATALQERFAEWLWSDGDRYVTLAATYNELCNSFVKPKYGTEFKQFPGLNPKYELYDYQAAAVQRFLHDETILLDHVVGAGKTLTMTVSCMEAKRLGQVRQPWVVVPNHLLSQWGNEARDAYPNAKILVASELDGIEDRQRFIGQTAVGDWDMVIVPQSVFGLIGMKREAQIEYLENEEAELRSALEAATKSGSEFSVKQIENAIKAMKKRIETIVGQKSSDDGLSFEQSGCDFMFIDEAHDFKNLSRPSNSADLSVAEGSQRATDLEMKARFLRKQAQDRNARAGKPHAPAKAMAFATGTPITNAMSEIWVMTKMLRPDLLARTGMSRIDNWAGTFAKPVTAVEMNITGTKLRMVTRMAEYANVPQLVAMLDQFRDVVTADQIPVRLPVIEGGTPTILEFDQGNDVLDFVADLDERLGNVKGDAMHIDNTLKISTDGRNVAMHPRLANLPAPPPENSRVEVAADAIWNTYVDNADVVIPADKYGPDMTGAFQLVFCDRGTPKVGESRRARNVYTELRDALIARGMKPEEIAFMHDHNSPKAKANLTEACRDGRIRVLL